MSQQARNRRVRRGRRIRSPELLDHRDRLLRLALRAVDGGELGEEAGVGGVGLEGGGEEGLGVGGLALCGEGVGEAGGGVGVVGGEGEEAAVGGFGFGEGLRVLGEVGAEEDVGGSLGGELQGLEELVARGVRIGALVEDGEGAQGAGAEGCDWRPARLLAAWSSRCAASTLPLRASMRPRASCGSASEGSAAMAAL